jgi:hypothetical protein
LGALSVKGAASSLTANSTRRLLGTAALVSGNITAHSPATIGYIFYVRGSVTYDVSDITKKNNMFVI